MSTIVSRTFRSSPYRDAAETWDAIVAILTQDRPSDARTNLVAVTGVVASLIADQVPKQSPIVVTCDGPRTRIYCLYDEDAVEGSDGNEEPLGFDALKGNWRISLPCPEDNLSFLGSTSPQTQQLRSARSRTDRSGRRRWR
jgi:hypothetical protein